jgi:HK97 family phage major capsid protein
MKTAQMLKVERKALHDRQVAILEKADAENRAMSAEEEAEYTASEETVKALTADIARRETLEARQVELDSVPPRRNSAPIGAPNFNRQTRLGDDELKATAFYIKHGDASAMKGLPVEQNTDFMAGSNNTDMNIGTNADGGYLVPTSHFQGIVAKKNESALYGPLGVTPYNGYPGTTLNVPVAGGSNVFVSTAESTGAVDIDAPVFDTAALTLVHFTKSLELTNDLREMEDSQLMTFLTGWVGRALALTHNSALVTEALASGTSVALAAQSAVSAGDVETMAYALAAEYADSAAFVMTRATLGKLRKLTGDPFLYQATPQGIAPNQLGGYPVFPSSFVAAVGSGNKSIVFGDFEYMGMREIPLTFLYDPYSKANTSRVMLHYRTSLVYKVTNADAILYGKHPTA